MMGCIRDHSFEVIVIVIGQRHLPGQPPLLIQSSNLLLAHRHFLWPQCHLLDQAQILVACQRPQDPEEGFFVLVVAFGGDIVVLESPLPVEGNLAGLDLPVLDVHLVAHHHDRHVLHHPRQIFVPLGDALVGDSGGDVEHEDGGVGANVVPLAQAAQLLLAGRVPKVQPDGAVCRGEGEGADLDALGRDVSLLELAGDVTLEEGGLPHAAVADQHHLELHCRLGLGSGV